jgi:hypothetical protein
VKKELKASPRASKSSAEAYTREITRMGNNERVKNRKYKMVVTHGVLLFLSYYTQQGSRRVVENDHNIFLLVVARVSRGGQMHRRVAVS